MNGSSGESSSASLKLGSKQALQGQNGNKFGYKLHILSPLPVCWKNLLNSWKTRERFQIEGHKFFSKISASGPNTGQILKGLQRSHGMIKSIRSFEFDPYLCDKSHINDLRRICHKIKGTEHVNLVIRRVNTSDELETLSPLIARFLRIRSVRVEFPNTQDVGNNGLMKLNKAIENCSFLKSIEWLDVNMPERLQDRKAGSRSKPKLKLLESFRYYGSLPKGALKNDLEKNKATPKTPVFLKLKNIDVTVSATGEWANKGIENDFTLQLLIKMFEGFPRLTTFKVKVIKTLPNYEDIVNTFTAMSNLSYLTHLDIEYLNCRISDMEVIAYVHGLMKVKQLKHFSLKVIQNSGISEDCIEKVSGALSRLDNLERFDLYFRKLDLHPRGITELGKRIEDYGNIHCSCSKEFIHIFRQKAE